SSAAGPAGRWHDAWPPGGRPPSSRRCRVMRRLSENLYRHEDSCVVYLLKDGESGVLVDFGLGSVLDHLPAAGVERVSDVLITHHHVDQAGGLERAAAQGIRVWVPHSEQDL